MLGLAYLPGYGLRSNEGIEKMNKVMMPVFFLFFSFF